MVIEEGEEEDEPEPETEPAAEPTARSNTRNCGTRASATKPRHRSREIEQ